MTTITDPSPHSWLPWRSVGLARLTTAVAVAVGVPIFLRMPPWCDVTLYDVAARNLLEGGVHYRDVFDTNMPGFVWVLAVFRALFGWSVEALRALDLVVVAAIVLALDQHARRAGADRLARSWAIAGMVVFYLFTSEFNHCQRDVWMFLPAVAAVTVRSRRLVMGESRITSAVLEGILWAVAVWIKPHAAIPATIVWLLTAPRMVAFTGGKGLLVDLAGNLLGGSIIGLCGIAYLVASSTWPHFVEVFTFWNTGYAELMWAELPNRFRAQLHYFPPWSYFQLVAIPLALLNILDGWTGAISQRFPRWCWDPATNDRLRFFRLILAALYLGWTAQGLFFQRDFHYVHVPETLMIFSILATHRWAAGFAAIAWLAISSTIVALGWAAPQNPPPTRSAIEAEWGLVFHHPSADANRIRLWPDCWRIHLSETDYHRRRNAAGLVKNFHGTNDWEQLHEIVVELQRRNARDGEVLCWHDAPHAAYLMLYIRPGFRFQHVSQMTGIGPAQCEQVRSELCVAAPRIRWVVSDLWRVGADAPEVLGDPTTTGPDLLPPGMIPEIRDEFPFDQPAVYRSGSGRGRYVIHELKHPIVWAWQLEDSELP